MMCFYFVRSVAFCMSMACCSLYCCSPLMGDVVRITEFMSEGQGDILQGNGGRRQREFFELTNLGINAVNTSAWSYNDNNINDPHLFAGVVDSIAPGESVIFTQMTAADFRTYWGLNASVKVFSYGQLSNLGNADTINIYNSAVQDLATLVDSLTYTADARGSGISRNRPWDGGTGQFPNENWIISSLGDGYQSFLAPSPTGFPPNFPDPAGPWIQSDYIDLANPGRYQSVAVPEPTAMMMVGMGLIMVNHRRRHRQMVRKMVVIPSLSRTKVELDWLGFRVDLGDDCSPILRR